MKILSHSLVTLAVVLLMGRTAQAEQVFNGDFEDPDIPGEWEFVIAIPGWTAAFGEIEIQRGGGVHTGQALPPGDQFIELDSSDVFGNSGMFQDVPTSPGGLYELSFYYSPRSAPDWMTFPASTNVIDVFWEGQRLASVAADSYYPGVNDWSLHTFDVVANSGTGFSRLQFNAGGNSDSYGGLLDNVSLVVVPEPGSMVALLAAALCLISARVGQRCCRR